MNTIHLTIFLFCCLIQLELGIPKKECKPDPNNGPNDLEEREEKHEEKHDIQSPMEKDENTCILDMSTDLPGKYQPLYVQRTPFNSMTPVLPGIKEEKHRIIELRKGESIIVSCPGKKNCIKKLDIKKSEVNCKGGNSMNFGDMTFKDIVCNTWVTATARTTQKNCAEGKGIIVELGFDVGMWIPLVESCHNVAKSLTYFSRHVMFGSITIEGKEKKIHGRPAFSKGGSMFFKGFNPREYYKAKKQLSILEHTFGKDHPKKYWGPAGKNYMTKGILAPPSDFVFLAHQASTYMYINVAPLWKSIRDGNWAQVERNARKIASKLRADLEVVTGTEGVLELQGKKGPKKINLYQSKLPVPRHFWKILRYPKDHSCIAFVSTNNPFLKENPAPICKDICAQNGWPVLQNDLSKGFVYCCEYYDLLKVIPYIPSLTCNSILQRK